MEAAAFDGALVAAQGGDEQAFALIWRAHNPALLRYLRVAVGPSDFEDAAASVWIDVVRALGEFSGDADGFRSWLFTIARRRALDTHRADRRRRADPVEVLPEPREAAVGGPDEPTADPAAAVADSLSTAAALELIATLSPDQAEVLTLRVIADLDVATVAEITGRKPGNVRVLAHRGLKRLAEILAESSDP